MLCVGPDRNEPCNPRLASLLDSFDADPFVRDVAMVVAPHDVLAGQAREKGRPALHREATGVPAPLAGLGQLRFRR
jgi:hypothetical protein